MDSKEPRWFAIYTNYKREKLVQSMLDQKGIHAYVPLQKVTRRYTRKIKTLELPLINCYVFVKITNKEYVPVLETENVLKFIRFSKNLISIPEAEIEIIKRVIGEGIEVEIEQGNRYKEGDEVEIVAGNLLGLKGRLISINGKKQMLVELENMGYSLRMEVEPSLLRKINTVTV